MDFIGKNVYFVPPLMDSNKLNIILLAAGKSTRMKSELPKVLHRLCGLTLFERSLRLVAGLSPQKIVLVLGHKKELVEEELARIKAKKEFQNISFEIVFQEKQNGTGDAARVGLEKCDEDSRVLILPADMPLIKRDTLGELLKSKAELALLSFTNEKQKGFGRIVKDNSGSPVKIVEEKDANSSEHEIKELNASIYLLKVITLRRALSTLTSHNAQNEYYLSDILEYASKSSLAVEAICLSESDELLGANTREELASLEGIRRKEINCAHMLAGVSFEDPERAYIDEDILIGEDSFIGSGSRIRGKTILGKNVTIEGDCLIIDSQIAAGTKIKLGMRIERAAIASDCSVGPFSQLRPGTELKAGVKVGNFVEIKNSLLHEGAKAGHLSYLGDAELGKDSNVGAGTITCNYDGISKHKTKIEADVFIGSNTALVAPVVVGRGATIGAGSVITKDVPAGALALERSAQKTISNWSKKKREVKK